MRHLLNRPYLAAVLSAAVAVAVVWGMPNWTYAFYKQNFAAMPGIAFTLLGFLVAAVTILLTLRDRPFLQALQRDRPELWKQAIAEFFVTTYLLALFGLVVLVLGSSIPSEEYQVYRVIFLIGYMILFNLSTIQMAKVIAVLHGISKY